LLARKKPESVLEVGIYRRPVVLASARHAMLDDGMGFGLVPWRPVIEQRRQLARHGARRRGGGGDWKTAWSIHRLIHSMLTR